MEIIVVGSGLSGAAAARVLAEKGHSVKIIEKLPHIGGNAYDYDQDGVLVHKYGPHIYHTNSDEAHAFLSRFTKWTPFKHKVLARINGIEVPVPFNLTSLEMLFPKSEAEYIKGVLIREYGENKKVPVFELKNHQNEIIKKFGEFVFQNIFYNYTLKQWGMKPEDLNPDIMKRVPVYIGYEDGYFTDKHQYMPADGYTAMIKNMLDHKNISVALNTDARSVLKMSNNEILFEGKKNAAKVIYTGCIDEFFGFSRGALRYRTLRFDFETHQKQSYQNAAVVNYPNSEAFTRISEFTKFTCPPQKETIIVKEYPGEHIAGQTIPYYPIEIEENNAVYKLYKADAEKLQNFYPLGRLGNYKYINMDTAILNAIKLAEEISL